MTDDELKQFTELAKKYEPANRDAVITAIKETAHDVFQEINDGGRAAANRDNQAKIEKAENDLVALTTDRNKIKADLDALDGKVTGAADLRRKYEDDLRVANEQFATKEKDLKEALKAERHKTAVSRLVDSLVQHHAVDREYAETIVAKRDDVNSRISVDDNSRITVYKEGTTDIPLVPPNDETTVVDLFAKQLSDKIDPKWKTSKVNRGSNTRGSGGDRATEDSGAATEYDAIRQSVKARSDVVREQNETRKGGLERLSGRR